jgi:hypothetical protein
LRVPIAERPQATIRSARSVRAAIFELQRAAPNLLVLDMSLPTFDIGPNEPGGRPQNLGGIEVLRYMDLYEITSPTIVVTGYEAFSKGGQAIDHPSLNNDLQREHPRCYVGLIYYNSLFSNWKKELSALMRREFGVRDENSDRG